MISKIKLIALNIICLLLMSYLVLLTWKQLWVTTPYYDNDYKTFYVTLNNKDRDDIYQTLDYVRILRYDKVQVIKNKKKYTVRISPPIHAINMNTPTMSMLLSGLVRTSQHLSNSTLIWTAATLLCAIISLLLMMRLWFEKNTVYYFLPFLLMLWVSWPSLYNLKIGEVSYFVLPFLCAAFYAMVQKNWRAMAIILAWLSSLKLFFLIFLLFFLSRRDWKNAAVLLSGLVVFSLLGLLYFPWSDYHAFFQMTQHRVIFVERSTLTMNGSLLGFVANNASFFKLTHSVIRVSIATSIIALYVLIRFFIFDVRVLQKLPELSNELSFCYWIVLALFCSPLAWLYYYLFLLIPLMLFFKVAERYVIPISFYVFLSAAFIFPFFAFIEMTNRVLHYLAHNCIFLSVLYWFLCLYLIARTIHASHYAPRFRAQKQVRILMGIVLVYTCISVILLSCNYGMNDFIYPDKTEYMKTAAPVMWLKK